MILIDIICYQKYLWCPSNFQIFPMQRMLSQALSLLSETFDYHYGKYHQTYVNNLNNLVKGTEWEQKSLDDIVLTYLSANLDIKTLKSWIMLPNVGTIPSIGIGIAWPLIKMSQVEISFKLSIINGDQSINS